MCLQLDSKRSKSAHSEVLRKCVFCVFTYIGNFFSLDTYSDPMCGRTESWILGVGLSSWLHIGSKGSPILSLNSWSCSPSVYLWFFSRRDKCHQFSSSFVWEPPVWVDGVKRSGGRHYLPPARQASQSFFNKENNLQLSGRRASNICKPLPYSHIVQLRGSARG